MKKYSSSPPQRPGVPLNLEIGLYPPLSSEFPSLSAFGHPSSKPPLPSKWVDRVGHELRKKRLPNFCRLPLDSQWGKGNRGRRTLMVSGCGRRAQTTRNRNSSGHTPNPPRQMRWSRDSFFVTTFSQKKERWDRSHRFWVGSFHRLGWGSYSWPSYSDGCP